MKKHYKLLGLLLSVILLQSYNCLKKSKVEKVVTSSLGSYDNGLNGKNMLRAQQWQLRTNQNLMKKYAFGYARVLMIKDALLVPGPV